MVVDYNYIYVYLIDMDTCIGECVRPTPDGGYAIFINARLSVDEQRYAFEHAINHIENGDFEKEDVQQIEAEAHGIIPREEAAYKGKKEIDRWLERLRAEHKIVHKQFERRWKRNNKRAEMGHDFFAEEQRRLDNLTE